MEAVEKVDISSLSDRELTCWAVQYGGWKYLHSTDQLCDPLGSLTISRGWENIGSTRRKDIIAQMAGSSTPSQIESIVEG